MPYGPTPAAARSSPSSTTRPRASSVAIAPSTRALAAGARVTGDRLELGAPTPSLESPASIAVRPVPAGDHRAGGRRGQRRGGAGRGGRRQLGFGRASRSRPRERQGEGQRCEAAGDAARMAAAMTRPRSPTSRSPSAPSGRRRACTAARHRRHARRARGRRRWATSSRARPAAGRCPSRASRPRWARAAAARRPRPRRVRGARCWPGRSCCGSCSPPGAAARRSGTGCSTSAATSRRQRVPARAARARLRPAASSWTASPSSCPRSPCTSPGHPPGLLLVMHALGIDTAAAAGGAVHRRRGAERAAHLRARARRCSHERAARLAGLLMALSPAALMFGVTSADAVYLHARAARRVAAARVRGRAGDRRGRCSRSASLFAWSLLAVGAWAAILALRRARAGAARSSWPRSAASCCSRFTARSPR